MDVAVSASDLHGEGSLVENTSAEMSPVARQANVDKLSGRKPDNSLDLPLGRPSTPKVYTHSGLFSGHPW